MKITVWSILSGRLSGHLVLHLPPTHTLKKVLEAYCTHKGASVSAEYVMRNRDNHILSLNKTLRQAGLENGDTLMIGLLSDEKQTFSFGSWYFVTFAAFIIGILGLGCVVWLCVQVLPSPRQYGVVIDAGSSHSEVFVFAWDGDTLLGTTAKVKLIHRCFIAGGINSFANHTQDLSDYFSPCLGEVKGFVPAPQRPRTPLYLGATAGMRILRKFDCDGASSVLSTLNQIFAANSAFKFQPQNVDIISGFEEGISGWIAVNYLANNLRKGVVTASVVDVGGASLQVTGEMPGGGPSQWKMKPVKLFNHTYKVRSKSFLCYGIIEARERYNYFLLHDNNTTREGEEHKQTLPATSFDPCLAQGFTREVTIEELKGPCTLTDDTTRPLLSQHYHINHSKLKRVFKNYRRQEKQEVRGDGNVTKARPGVTLQGSGNTYECGVRLRRLFDRRLCESTFRFGDCMEAQTSPLFNGTLYAYSGLFHHVMAGLGLGPGASLGLFKGVVAAMCDVDAASLHSMYPDLEREIAEELCFEGMFVYTLLTVGLGVTNETWSSVVFSDEIGNTEVVWPQGYMINKTSDLTSEAPRRPLPLAAFTLLLCLFSAFVVCGFMFLHHALKISRHSTSYQRCDSHLP